MNRMIPCTVELPPSSVDTPETGDQVVKCPPEPVKTKIILDPNELDVSRDEPDKHSWINITLEPSESARATRRDDGAENGRTSTSSWLLNCLTCFRHRKKATTSERSVASWSSSSFRQFIKKSKFTRCSFYKNNISFFLAIFIFLIIQVVLVIVQMNVYAKASVYIKLARANGILLDFNSSLIIFLVLRRMITWIRDSKIGRAILPLDDFIMFHKIIGVIILLASIFHTIAHCMNLCKLRRLLLHSSHF